MTILNGILGSLIAGGGSSAPRIISVIDNIVTGTALPSTTVTVYLDGVSQGTAMSDADGNWTYDLGSISAGDYEVTASIVAVSDPFEFTASAPPERIVAYGGYIPDTQFDNSAGTWDRFETRTNIRIGRQDARTLRLVFYNGYLPQGLPEADNANDITIEAGIESVTSPTATVMCTFSGNPTITLAPGDIVLSDPIVPADFSLATFAAHRSMYARVGVTGFGTGLVPQSSQVYSAISGENNKASLGGSSQINGTGALAGANNVKGLIPCAVLGEWDGTEDISVLVLGDSIITGPSTSKFNGTSGGGYVSNGLASVGTGIVAYTKASRSGGKASEFNSANSNPLREFLMQYATHLIENYGVNDLRANVAGTTVLADKEELWSLFRSLSPVGYIVSTPVVPDTLDDNVTNFTEFTNQTPFNGRFGTGNDRDVLNAAVLAAVGTDIDEYIDTDSVWEAPEGSDPELGQTVGRNKWILGANITAPGGVATGDTANFATDDGTHPSANRHTAAGTLVNTAAGAWTP